MAKKTKTLRTSLVKGTGLTPTTHRVADYRDIEKMGMPTTAGGRIAPHGTSDPFPNVGGSVTPQVVAVINILGKKLFRGTPRTPKKPFTLGNALTDPQDWTGRGHGGLTEKQWSLLQKADKNALAKKEAENKATLTAQAAAKQPTVSTQSIESQIAKTQADKTLAGDEKAALTPTSIYSKTIAGKTPASGQTAISSIISDAVGMMGLPATSALAKWTASIGASAQAENKALGVTTATNALVAARARSGEKTAQAITNAGKLNTLQVAAAPEEQYLTWLSSLKRSEATYTHALPSNAASTLPAPIARAFAQPTVPISSVLANPNATPTGNYLGAPLVHVAARTNATPQPVTNPGKSAAG